MSNSFASIALTYLKNNFQGPVISQFNEELPFYGQMEKGQEKYTGNAVIRAMKLRRNLGIGATTDGGPLPGIGNQGVAQATIQSKFNYLRFGITGPMIKAAQGDKGAYVNGLSYEMEQGLQDLKKDVNRQLFWDGTSDLATVSANATGSNVITVTGRESTEAGSKFLDVGMVIDIYSTTNVLKASAVSITAMSGTTTATLTLSAAVTCVATDIVVRNGALNNEIQGVLYSQDGGTTSIFSIDRSVYPSYQGNVINGNGGQLTLDLMQQAFNEPRRRGGAKTNYIVCDFDSERFYNKLLVSDKRFVGKVVGDGTFSDKDRSYLEYGGVPVVPDAECPTRFFFLDSTSWKKYVLAELDWADESGAPMIAQVGADAYEARLRLFANIFPEKCSANSALRNYISP